MKVYCSDCRFFGMLDPANGRGLCHKYAPRPHLSQDDDFAYWPIVSDDDWCGEAEPALIAKLSPGVHPGVHPSGTLPSVPETSAEKSTKNA